jgi:Pyruvate/2-oxoacid:ferredoxin oxidoreductase delta subunit
MPGKDIDPGGKGYGLAGRIVYGAARLGLGLSRIPLAGALVDRVAAKKRFKVLTIPTGIVTIPAGIVTIPTGIVTIPVGAAIKGRPAVLPFDAARQLVEAASCIVVTDTCLCRESHRCEDYPVGLGCLFLGQGARQMSLHGRAHPISRDAALAHLERARSLGLVNNLIWSTAELRALGAEPSRTVELCSCCPCCCLAFRTRNASRAFVDGIAGFGVAKAVAPEDCTRCTNCARACPFGAIQVDMHAGPRIDASRCKGCGRCEIACKPRVLKIFPVEPAGRATPVPGTMYFEEFLTMVR